MVVAHGMRHRRCRGGGVTHCHGIVMRVVVIVVMTDRHVAIHD